MRAQATVDAILEATARIVRREGLAGLNTNKIAERTGISVGTLYGYFPDKTAILVALARRMLERDAAALLTASEGGSLRGVIRQLLAQHRTDPALRRAVMSVHIGEGHGDEHSDRVEQFVSDLTRCAPLADLGNMGDLRLFVATRAVLGIARALVDEGVSRRFSDAEIESEAILLLAGYLSPPATPSPASPGAARTNF